MTRSYRLVSADSHVLEPPHLWTSYMPRKYHDRVPRVVPDGEGGEAWQFAPGTPPAPIGIHASAGRPHEEIRWTGVRFADANPGCFAGGPRIQEQDRDGIDAEVLYGSSRMMSHFFSDPDPEFQLAGVRAYNDWLAEEFVRAAPDRLIGLACMPALSVEAAIAEMERCLRLGLRGVWLNAMPSVGPTIRPDDDPFWEAAQSNGVPVHIHVRWMRQIQKPRPKGVRGGDLAGLASVGAADMIVGLAEIIQSGVHDRFPDLTWVMVEAGSGWIPYLLEQLDDRWRRNRSWLPVPLENEPSYYYRRNWRSTFMIDRYAVENRHTLGVENMLFATDYPHHGCDWPNTRQVTDALFEGVPADERDALCAGNAVRLYGLA